MVLFYTTDKMFIMTSTGGIAAGVEDRADQRGLKMWYFILFMLGAVVCSILTFLRYETKCRDCGIRENCEEFP